MKSDTWQNDSCQYDTPKNDSQQNDRVGKMKFWKNDNLQNNIL